MTTISCGARGLPLLLMLGILVGVHRNRRRITAPEGTQHNLTYLLGLRFCPLSMVRRNLLPYHNAHLPTLGHTPMSLLASRPPGALRMRQWARLGMLRSKLRWTQLRRC